MNATLTLVVSAVCILGALGLIAGRGDRPGHRHARGLPVTHPDPKGRSRGTMRLRRSAAAGRNEQWVVTYAGRQHVVEGDEAAAVAKLRELSHDAQPKRPA